MTPSAQGKSKPKRKRGIKHHFDLAEDILMCVDENIAHYREEHVPDFCSYAVHICVRIFFKSIMLKKSYCNFPLSDFSVVKQRWIISWRV